jgi:ornithine cyclodeaminase/alanine dehydrogenase
MDGTYITGLRTGATSAVASKYLARRSSTILGLFGAGVQAGFQLWALRTIFPLQKVLVYSRTPAKTEAFAKDMRKKYQISVEVASQPQDVVRESHILVTATTSQIPVFERRDISPGTHINAIGAFTPHMREVDSETIQMAKIVVDSYQGALAEAGDLLIPMQEGLISKQDLYAELSELIMGQKIGRTNDQEVTIFKSVGFAIEDAITAKLAYEKALEQGIGTVINRE